MLPLPAGAMPTFLMLAVALAMIAFLSGRPFEYPSLGRGSFGPGSGWAAISLTGFMLATWWFWRRLREHPHRRYGKANGITHLRLACVAWLGGSLAVPGWLDEVPRSLAWVVVWLATIAAVLDAADGPLARREGTASAWGAWFDMETDALMIMVLCILVWQWDKAGAWVLLCGLLRPAFVLAARIWPWLHGDLPPSMRRKTMAVAQIVVLIVCLGPIVPTWVATPLAGLGLVGLLVSFAIDVRWLKSRVRSVSG